MKNIKKIAFLMLGLFLVISIKAYAVWWEDDLETALAKAKKSQKPVMVDFYTEWCGWCKKLDSDTYSDNKVDGLAKKFICVKVDGDKNREAASKYQIEGYPTIIFLSYEGKIDERVVGYRDANSFAGIMSSVLKKTKKPAAKSPEITKDKAPAATPAKGQKPQFTLNGIIYDVNAPTALINGTLVKVGDTIEGAKVKKITKVDVELEYQESVIVLNIR